MTGDKTINGMPVNAIEKMITNSKTPKHLKESWKRKLKEMS